MGASAALFAVGRLGARIHRVAGVDRVDRGAAGVVRGSGRTRVGFAGVVGLGAAPAGVLGRGPRVVRVQGVAAPVDLRRVVDAVPVGVGVLRVESAVHLLAVGQAVAVGVGIVGVGAEEVLHLVRQAVA